MNMTRNAPRSVLAAGTVADWMSEKTGAKIQWVGRTTSEK
jgi:hypothetical protein